ncbi:MAG: MarR family transcriptional regulator [Lactobacillaceae bacterium]|jgi:DNA-binding MarR family transcriptional regulator|nr:MarR family transcriptional regulator [Lactobacillaceae bacterium]
MNTILDALRDTDKTYQQVLKKITKDANITIAEWQLLINVEAGLDTQDKLSKDMGLDNSTLSRQLGSLVQKDLAMHVAVGRDKRQLIYELSNSGQRVLAQVNQQHAAYSDSVFKMWSDEEKSMIQILLKRLNKSLAK